MTEFVAGDALFSDAFVMYMARLFVAFDATTAAWYRTELSYLPVSWGEAKATAHMLEKLGALGASLRHGLLSAPGGASAVWAKLQVAWADKPGAAAQLVLLFSLPL